MRQLGLLALPILILLISGCTLPGGITLPGFGPVQAENDVLVISSLTPYPATVSTGQSINLVAYIKNQGSETMENVKVDLYDYCGGLFTKVDPVCGAQAAELPTGCELNRILPKETREVKWTLEPTAVKLPTECELKVLVRYPFKTTSLTTVHFINPTEYQSRLEQGTFQETESYIAQGEGPVKAYFTVQDRQPVAAISGGHTNLALNVENLGRGFVQDARISGDKLEIDWAGFDAQKEALKKVCRLAQIEGNATEYIRFIQRKSPPIPCQINNPDLTGRPELTKQLTATVSYIYEFRSSAKVTVNPRK